MKLQWKSSYSASCMHAVIALREGLPVVDTDLSESLHPVCEELFRCLDQCGLNSEKACNSLVGLAAEVENNKQLAEQLIKRELGSNSTSSVYITQLAGAIADLESTMLKVRPNLLDELEVRARPLCEQWESRGPGLMRRVAQITEDPFVVPTAEVVLVSPITGGHGRAHLPMNRVTFEAVLTNPHADLPEAIRMGWLLAQLNLDLPKFADLIPGPRKTDIAMLSTLPLILSAAEHVEWAELSEESLSRALECWHLPPDLPQDTPQRLLNWWQTYLSGNTCWGVATAALVPMLFE